MGGEEAQAAVLCDFDGTVVTIDTAEYTLNHFVDSSWRLLDAQYKNGEISFEESLRREFRMIRASKEAILDYLNKVTSFRPNFEKLVEYCKKERISFVIVSGGLDFSIQHFLGQKRELGAVEVFAPKAHLTPNGIELTLPRLIYPDSTNFKDDLVRHYRNRRYKVWFIGNGRGDLPAAKVADFTFAVRDSTLDKLCRDTSIANRVFSDFQEVIDALNDFRTQPSTSRG